MKQRKNMIKYNRRKIRFILFFLLLTFSVNFISAGNLKNLVLEHNPRLIHGDANADGEVNIFDLAVVGLNYGTDIREIKSNSLNTQSSFNEFADLNNDRIVDIFDLAIVGMKYNSVFPQQLGETDVFMVPEFNEIYFGESFGISINISTNVKVFALEGEILFDSSILNVSSVQEGDFLKKDGEDTFKVINFNNENGKIEFAITRIGTQEGVSGDNSLILIEFIGIKKGETSLEINKLILVDENLQEILGVETNDGFVGVVTNKAPVIESYSPVGNPVIDEGVSQLFTINASDPEDDDLDFRWFVDGVEVGTGNSYTFNTDHDSQGNYEIKVFVSDGEKTTNHSWVLNVNDNLEKVYLSEGTQIFSIPRIFERGKVKFNELDTDCNISIGGDSVCSGANLAYRDVFSGNWICLGLNDDLYSGMGYFIKVENDCWVIANGSSVDNVGYLGTNNVYNTGIYNHTIIGAPSVRTNINNIKGNCNIFALTKYVKDVTSCVGVPDYNGKEEFCWTFPGTYCYCGTDWLNPGKGYLLEVLRDCQLGV